MCVVFFLLSFDFLGMNCFVRARDCEPRPAQDQFFCCCYPFLPTDTNVVKMWQDLGSSVSDFPVLGGVSKKI